jgi:chitin disaccharide deacetylase
LQQEGGTLLSFDQILAGLTASLRRNKGAAPSRTLAELLGYSSQDRVLIVNCDDLGSSQSANRAVERALRTGFATSATLMVPCPWARNAAIACRDLDVGIHLTLTSEYPAYRWRSLTGAASLHDKDGYLPKTAQEIWAKGDLADIDRECRAQIDQACEWGLEPTHIDSHMHVLQLDRHLFDVYMRLAIDYGLPLRLHAATHVWPFAYIARRTLQGRGIVTPDRFIEPPWGEPLRKTLLSRMDRLLPGVTEVSAHPADDSEELHAYDEEYAEIRAADARFLVEAAMRHAFTSRGVKKVGYAMLRDAMRTLMLERNASVCKARARAPVPHGEPAGLSVSS